MDTRWTTHLETDSQKESFRKLLKNNGVIFRRLWDLLEEEERKLSVDEISYKDFEDPNWSHKQAFRNGDRSRLKKLKDLISFIKE